MKKDIKDYLHLYLMSSYQWKDGDGEWRRPEILTAYQLNSIRQSGREVRLILRPLSDMTDDEAVTIYEELFPDVEHDSDTKVFYVKGYCSEEGLYYKGNVNILEDVRFMLACLKGGFDLFNLIPEGLAIDKTKLKQPA